MRHSKLSRVGWGIAAIAAMAGVLSSGHLGKQTLAPHEINTSDAPPPILRDTSPLPKGGVNLDSAEERHLRVVVITKGLQQPWSLAFFPDGAVLVTERSGRLRIVRNGSLVPSPIAGVPPVHTGGPRGLQGLMDVALHPHFEDNKWVYLVYHKLAGDDTG